MYMFNLLEKINLNVHADPVNLVSRLYKHNSHVRTCPGHIR